MSIDEYPGSFSGLEYKLVTSGARPSSPTPGQMIYELDTGRGRLWDGGGWKLTGPEFPVVRGRATAQQSIGNAQWTAITLGTVDVDNWNSFSGGAPTRLTCQENGYYNIEGGVVYSPNGTGGRGAGLRKNGSGFTGPSFGTSIWPPYGIWASSGRTTANGIWLVVGDYIELLGLQNSGGALNTLIEDGNPCLSMTYVGGA